MVYAIFVLPRYLQDSQRRLEKQLAKQMESLPHLDEVLEEQAVECESTETEASAEPLLTRKKDN